MEAPVLYSVQRGQCKQHTHVSAGCTFANFDTVYVATLEASQETTHVSFSDCTFTGNTIYPRGSHMNTAPTHGALLAAKVWHMPANSWTMRYGNIKVRLEGCAFTDNTHKASEPWLLADERGEGSTEALFYTDSSSVTVCTYVGEFTYADTPPCAATNNPLELSEAGDGFLSTVSEWLAEVQQVRFLA